jgi:hypothetical protein
MAPHETRRFCSPVGLDRALVRRLRSEGSTPSPASCDT